MKTKLDMISQYNVYCVKVNFELELSIEDPDPLNISEQKIFALSIYTMCHQVTNRLKRWKMKTTCHVASHKNASET